MRKSLAIIIALCAWFAVVVQAILMLKNRTAAVPETIIRFFSFFTILTNTLVALYFTGQCLNVNRTYKPGMLTAVAVYIFIVGIIYQILLRHIWQPTGLQLIVDELLHTLNPVLVMVYWYLYEKKSLVNYKQVKGWLLYPVAYLIYTIIRGYFSGFYPYPFVNVTEIGFTSMLLNSGLLMLLFIIVALLFIIIGRKTEKKSLRLT